MNKSGKTFSTIILTMILTMLFCYVAFKVTNYKFTLEKGEDKTNEDETNITENDYTLSKIEAVKNIIDSKYLRQYNEESLADGAAEGMLDSLGDPYAVYYNASAFANLMTKTEGEYDGIGIYISYDDAKKMPIILTPLPDSPAEKVGLLPGDYIEYIDDTMSSQVSYEELVDKIKGKKGTTLDIGIIRYKDEENFERLEFTVERQDIELNPLVENVYENDIGYIKMPSFDEVTFDDFSQKYDDLINNKKVKGLIIDLRDNPGGVLNACVNITDLLTPAGRIVYTVDKEGNEVDYDTEKNGEDKQQINIPLVVLVNGNSASASEVFTAAIKDYKIGTIIGEKTFGKGVVQTLISLGDGTYMKLTTSEYFSPKGNKIDGIGITPDIEVELPNDVKDKYVITFKEDTQLQRAIEEIKSKI